MTNADPRVIEDYLPIQAISAEASREKSVRKGHISTLHLWWARRPRETRGRGGEVLRHSGGGRRDCRKNRRKPWLKLG
jgi:hypothetical protein